MLVSDKEHSITSIFGAVFINKKLVQKIVEFLNIMISFNKLDVQKKIEYQIDKNTYDFKENED